MSKLTLKTAAMKNPAGFAKYNISEIWEMAAYTVYATLFLAMSTWIAYFCFL
jgi:hypothetical protein